MAQLMIPSCAVPSSSAARTLLPPSTLPPTLIATPSLSWIRPKKKTVNLLTTSGAATGELRKEERSWSGPMVRFSSRFCLAGPRGNICLW